jgi:hypothetical protein
MRDGSACCPSPFVTLFILHSKAKIAANQIITHDTRGAAQIAANQILWSLHMALPGDK